MKEDGQENYFVRYVDARTANLPRRGKCLSDAEFEFQVLKLYKACRKDPDPFNAKVCPSSPAWQIC